MTASQFKIQKERGAGLRPSRMREALDKATLSALAKLWDAARDTRGPGWKPNQNVQSVIYAEPPRKQDPWRARGPLGSPRLRHCKGHAAMSTDAELTSDELRTLIAQLYQTVAAVVNYTPHDDEEGDKFDAQLMDILADPDELPLADALEILSRAQGYYHAEAARREANGTLRVGLQKAGGAQ